MRIEIKDATLRDLTYTLSNARQIDKDEILASGPRSLTEAGFLTHYLTERVGGFGKVVCIDGNPEVAFGFTCQSELTPWLFSAWAWGSDKMPLCMPAIGRWAADEMLIKVQEHGMVRIEARSMAEHTQAHRWLLWMHFEREADLVDWGRDGRRFVLFAWTRTRFAKKVSRDNVKGVAAGSYQALLAEMAAKGQRDVLRVEPTTGSTADSGCTDN